MESGIEHTRIDSDFFDKHRFQKQLNIIKQASEIAQAKIDFESAHDDNIIRAIDIVEDFLRKKHRLCYGGQAINAHLPAKYKFYDPEFSIPDYDFFTPNQQSDITLLVKDLKRAGFTEISVREGMHEGTIKIYVDYIPVADMTSIDPKLYRILSKREYRIDGISYLDANTLRMLMYLELSRPRGEVGRWSKVFERLSLFNEFVPVRHCRISREAFRGGLTEEETKFTLDFIVQNKRIFAGADLLEFYDTALKRQTQNVDWIVGSNKPIVFLSPDADSDAKKLREEFNFLIDKPKYRGNGGNRNSNRASNRDSNRDSNRGSNRGSNKGRIPEMTVPKSSVTIKSFSSKGVDLIPSIRVLVQGNKSLIFIIEQTACHSYFNVPVDDNKIMRIASMDTLITLYFSLGLFDSNYYDMGSMECLANHLVQISIKARTNPEKFGFPFVAIKCTGHQISLPSLIRAKVKRITQKKQELKQLLENKTKTPNFKRRTIRNNPKSFL